MTQYGRIRNARGRAMFVRCATCMASRTEIQPTTLEVFRATLVREGWLHLAAYGWTCARCQHNHAMERMSKGLS